MEKTKQEYLQELREEEHRLYQAIYEIEQMSDEEFIDLGINEDLNRDEFLKELYEEYYFLESEIEKEEETTTGFTIAYPNADCYIGKPMDLHKLMTDLLTEWDYDKTIMTDYEAENVASIRENYEKVFYTALEVKNYWKGQEFEETFGL